MLKRLAVLGVAGIFLAVPPAMEQLLIKKYKLENNGPPVKVALYMGERCEHRVQLQWRAERVGFIRRDLPARHLGNDDPKRRVDIGGMGKAKPEMRDPAGRAGLRDRLLELVDLSDDLRSTEFKVFSGAEMVKCIVVPEGAKLTRAQVADPLPVA